MRDRFAVAAYDWDMTNAKEQLQLQVFYVGDDLPGAAADLLGHDVEDAFAQADAQAACVAALSAQGHWRGALLLLDDPDAQSASIRQMVITPQARGQGLAGRLVRQAMQIAQLWDRSRIRTTAGWGCPDHRAFYERMQFDRVGQEESPYLMSRRV